jgi:hypothetical protein
MGLERRNGYIHYCIRVKYTVCAMQKDTVLHHMQMLGVVVGGHITPYSNMPTPEHAWQTPQCYVLIILLH